MKVTPELVTSELVTPEYQLFSLIIILLLVKSYAI